MGIVEVGSMTTYCRRGFFGVSEPPGFDADAARMGRVAEVSEAIVHGRLNREVPVFTQSDFFCGGWCRQTRCFQSGSLMGKDDQLSLFGLQRQLQAGADGIRILYCERGDFPV